MTETRDPSLESDPGDDASEATNGPDAGVDLTDEVDCALSLIAVVESRVPEPYRLEIVRALLPQAIGRGTGDVTPSTVTRPRAASTGSRLQLAPYASVLSTPGKMLLKALVALEATSLQLGIEWMTPSEIERFLAERARVPSVYRTNLSNALRAARDLVDRRRRGRAYEYRITRRGRAALERDLAIGGS